MDLDSRLRQTKFSTKISFRLTVVYVTTLLLSCLTIGIVVYSSLADVVKKSEADSMSQRTAEYKFSYLEGGMPGLLRLVEFHRKEFPKDKFGLILENQSGVIYKSDGPFKEFSPKTSSFGFNVELIENQSLDYALKDFILKQGWTEILKFFNFEVVYVNKISIVPDVHLTYLQTFPTIEKDFVRVRMLGLFLLAVFITVGLIIGYTLSRKVILPIRKFINTIDRLEAGDTAARVAISEEGNEFNVLAKEFNKLMDSKDALVQGINDTLDTVAHEIRTPLTRFRIGAEVAISNKTSQIDTAMLLRDGLEASEHISYLLTNILESSKAKNGIFQLERSKFLLIDLVSELKDIYSFLLEEKDISLEIDVGDSFSIYADRRLILQAINNLLDNAIKYTSPSGKVSIRAIESKEFITISISDTGIGVPVEEQTKIWQRLYRSRNSSSDKGYGIGLSVVKSIIELHNGTVSVQSEILKGSTFTVNLYKA